jgi:hypothetical protein
MQLAARKMSGQIDLTHIALGLLNGTFKSDFLNERSYMQWKSRQVKINFRYQFYHVFLPCRNFA